eukprot:scaffold28481_cov129-Isochrysis_galbana.AAC.2
MSTTPTIATAALYLPPTRPGPAPRPCIIPGPRAGDRGLNDSERSDWVSKSLGQHVDSRRVAAHLPRLDAYDMAAALQTAVREGVLGPDVRAADRDAELVCA